MSLGRRIIITEPFTYFFGHSFHNLLSKEMMHCVVCALTEGSPRLAHTFSQSQIEATSPSLSTLAPASCPDLLWGLVEMIPSLASIFNS